MLQSCFSINTPYDLLNEILMILLYNFLIILEVIKKEYAACIRLYKYLNPA
jgi:hypothetical protein